MTGVLIQGGNLDTDHSTNTHNHVMIKTEIRVMLLQARDARPCQPSHKLEERHGGQILLSQRSEETPLQTP